MTSCEWLYEITPEREATWGGEAVALAAIARVGVPVVPSFVVSRDVFFHYFNQSSIRHGITKALRDVSLGKPQVLAGAAKELRQIILKGSLQGEHRSAIGAYLEELEDQLLVSKGAGLPLVFIGQTPTRPMVQGMVKTLTDAEKLLKQLFALPFEDRALHARLEEDIVVPPAFAVLVQYARPTELSGMAHQFDPERQDETIITIRAHHHEHGVARHGSAEDIYRFDAKTATLLSKSEVHHHWAEKHDGHKTPKRSTSRQHADDVQMTRLAKMIRRSQSLFSVLQGFRWALSGGQLWIQGAEPFRLSEETEHTEEMPLLIGAPGNLGVAIGPLRRIKKKADWDLVEDGDIILAEHLTSGDAEHLAGVAGIITESGHMTAPEAIYARQLGVPAVVGVGHAMNLVKDGQILTLDGTRGAVYAGRFDPAHIPTTVPRTVLPVTGTKVYGVVRDLLSIPEELDETDGIGVLRSESILALLGVYPQDIIHRKAGDEYVSILAEGIERVARAVYPRPVVYQLHDLAGSFLAPRSRHEPNPILGYRGAHRLLHEPETLELELRALHEVGKRGMTTIQLMIPMVRSLDELKAVQKLLKKYHTDFDLPEELWVRCETPGLAIQADALGKHDIYGVCFDIPALSALIIGMDGGNHQVGHHVDSADDAVLQALEFGITSCRAQGIVTSVVAEGEMPQAEAIETAVRAGVTAVVVEPPYIEPAHGLIASIEQRMLTEHVIDECACCEHN